MANTGQQRRRFLKDLVWGTMAAGLTAFTAFLFSRRGDEHCCTNRWICTECSRLVDCILPQALSARQHGAGGKANVRGSDAG
ncbi:MAG: hypothetical protein JSV89_16165 [Spirochaetaceae bacterium]|nr:MAG: hypothetical protein JSV89_16165 [Spirochaetaceae bacterium]